MNALNILFGTDIFTRKLSQSIPIRFNIYDNCVNFWQIKMEMPIYKSALTFYKNETKSTKFYLDSFNSKNKQFKIKCISQEGFSLFDFMFKRFTIDIDSWLCTRYLCTYVCIFI